MIGFLNTKESENGFCDSLLIFQIMVRQRDRRIHSESGFFGSFDVP